jgi:hypothetical protein
LLREKSSPIFKLEMGQGFESLFSNQMTEIKVFGESLVPQGF